jgi:PAS domain S-box-containing protein
LIKCLYVDDEPALLELAKEFLENGGAVSVRTCDAPEMAMGQIDEEKPDVVISDYQMPGMDGIDLFKAVRAAGHDVPFILFTGKGREEVAIEALNAGIDFYLNKGGNPRAQFAELENVVKQLARRREAEDAVSYNNRRFRHIIENIMDVVLIIDTRGLIKYVSPSTRHSIGYRPDELLGTCVFDFLHRDDREPMINSSTCTGKSVVPLQCRVRTRNGDYRWFESVSRALPSELGEGQFIISSRDINERKSMELEIARRELLLKTVYDNSMEMMGLISLKGEIQMVNRRFCEISGYEEGYLITRNFLDFVAPDSQEMAARNLELKAVGKEERTAYRAMLHKKDGSEVWLGVISQRIDVPGEEAIVLVMGRELPEEDMRGFAGGAGSGEAETSPVISLKPHGPDDT